ncbi:MAG: branched-chain amino acid ABC transporter permease [Desulfobacterales bacterium]|nr:branched-chain amino acid ABC transporter permease [Desulfobacterales bacterium]
MTENIRRKERVQRGIKVRSDTIYAIASWQELTYLLAPRLLLILGLLALPFLVPNMYWQRIISIFGVYAMLAIGFDFLANYVGLVCLGSAMFVGAGGYISGFFNMTFGWSPLICIPIGTVLGAILCTLALRPCLHLRGIYFVLVSFIYPLVAIRIIVATGIIGGTEGISALDVIPNFWLNQYLMLGVLLCCLFAMRRLVNSDAGLVFRGLMENDQAIKASGIDITRCRTVAVFITALIGCFAGAYLTHLYGWVGTSLFAIDFSILPVAASVVGGGGTLIGAVLGCLILIPVSEALRAFGTLRVVFYSIIIVLFIVFWSEGLFQFVRRKYEEFERWVKV